LLLVLLRSWSIELVSNAHAHAVIGAYEWLHNYAYWSSECDVQANSKLWIKRRIYYFI